MAMEINQNYSSYAAQSMAQNNAVSGTKKKEPEKTQQKTESSKSESTAEYAKKLAKLVPSVEFRVGSSFAADKSGKTLTVSPMLLEKMQNDPEKEKEMKELIKGVESMERLSESLNKATGWTTVFRHSYIDENGKYCHIALVRNDFMLNMSDKLREERRKNSEKLLEKQKEKSSEKSSEKKEELQEKEKKAAEEKTDETSCRTKAERFLEEKTAASKDGMIYMDNTEFKTLLEAIKEENEEKTNKKQEPQAGANLDLWV